MVEQCNTSCVKAVAEISMFSHFLGGGGRGGNNNKNIRQIININSVSNVSLCTDPEFHGLLHIWMVHSVCIHGDDHRLIINYQRLKNFSPRPAHQYIYTARK